MEFVPLKLEHILAIWNKPPPVTCEGFAVIEGERLMGVAALYPDEASRRMILVSYICEEGRNLLRNGRACRVLLHAARRILREGAKVGVPVHAVADPEIYGSRALLEHLGFKHYKGDTYSWAGSQ